jgi:chromosome segregation ATPase
VADGGVVEPAKAETVLNAAEKSVADLEQMAGMWRRREAIIASMAGAERDHQELVRLGEKMTQAQREYDAATEKMNRAIQAYHIDTLPVQQRIAIAHEAERELPDLTAKMFPELVEKRNVLFQRLAPMVAQLNQLRTAVATLPKTIASDEAQINNAGDSQGGWRVELIKHQKELAFARERLPELEKAVAPLEKELADLELKFKQFDPWQLN